MKFKIHINDNYRVEPLGVFNTFSWLYTNSVSHSGKNLALVGPNDEYLVYSRVAPDSVKHIATSTKTHLRLEEALQ